MKTIQTIPHLLITVLLVLASACAGKVRGDAAPTLGACCQASMKLVAEMPECCRKGVSVAGHLSGCCATGLLEETAAADRGECCTKTMALLQQFSPCCRKTLLTGEADSCCEAMPGALLAQRPR